MRVVRSRPSRISTGHAHKYSPLHVCMYVRTHARAREAQHRRAATFSLYVVSLSSLYCGVICVCVCVCHHRVFLDLVFCSFAAQLDACMPPPQKKNLDSAGVLRAFNDGAVSPSPSLALVVGAPVCRCRSRAEKKHKTKRGVRFRKEEQLLRAEEEARRKMEGADARRKEHRRGIVRKANDANSKVGRAPPLCCSRGGGRFGVA